MGFSPRWYQFLVAVFASIGAWLYGYDLGVIAEVIACDNFNIFFNKPSASTTGAVVALFTGGAFFGAGFGGPLGDWLGRRITIIAGAIVFLLGGALQTGARNISYLFAGRFIAGLGVGVLVMIVPVYQAELAHPNIRGRVTALQQFMIGVGALCAAWISYGAYAGLDANDSAQWRMPLGIQMIPAVFLAALIMLFPESPRWLVGKGRKEEGLRTLAKLHAHGDTNDSYVVAEYAQIKHTVAHEASLAKSLSNLFSNKTNIRRLVLCMALQASVQMTGVSAIQYFSVDIYAQIGISGKDTLKYQGFTNIIALFAETMCLLFVDLFGRRKPLILGNIGNMLTYIVATALLANFPPSSKNTGAHWSFVSMVWVYNLFFSAMVGPLSFIIPAEVFDFSTRSAGVAIATMTSFAFNTMIGQVTPIAIEGVSWRYYILFAICNFTNAVFFWAFLPETKKVPLEQMGNLFREAPVFCALWKRPTVLTEVTDEEISRDDNYGKKSEAEQRVEYVG